MITSDPHNKGGIFIFLGLGSVSVGKAFNKKAKSGRIIFEHLDVPQEIGAEVVQESSYPPITLHFAKVESLDVLLKQLNKLRIEMTQPEPLKEPHEVEPRTDVQPGRTGANDPQDGEG